MIVPARVYRRITKIDKRLWSVAGRLTHETVLASGIIEQRLEHLPDDERREVLRLLKQGLDDTGNLDPDRLSDSERTFLSARLRKGMTRS